MFLPEEESGTLIIKFFLQAAVMLGLVILTSSNEVTEVDILITFWLLTGPVPSLNPERFNPFATWLGLARIFMATATAAYYTWFWFVGWDKLLKPGCTAVVFFGNVTVNSPFRLFSTVIAAIWLVVCAGLIGTRIVRLNKPDNWRSRSAVELELDNGKFVGLLIVSVVITTISIAMVEHLILANHVGSVNDLRAIGQLIALLTGVLSLAGFCKKRVDSGMEKRAEARQPQMPMMIQVVTK
jgi:hypothetical protein